MTLARPGVVRVLVCAAAITAGLGSVAVAATLVMADASVEFGQPTDTVGPTVPTTTATPTASSAPAAGAPSDPLPVGLADLVPERLVIENIGVAAPVVPVSVSGGALLVPTDPATVGWWTGGAYPGAATGTVLVAGHVDYVSVGPGALYHLTSLREGDRVRLDTAAGPHPYRVVARRDYPKQQLPQDLFDRGGPPRLVLVTCGGAFTPEHGYADNVVVYAEPDTGS